MEHTGQDCDSSGTTSPKSTGGAAGSTSKDSPTLFPLETSEILEAYPKGIGSLPEDSLANHSAQHPEGERLPPIFGPKCYGSSKSQNQFWSLGRTFSMRLSKIPLVNYTNWGITLRFSEYPPPLWVQRITGRDSSWLPTPTATANHLAPSMRKWPTYRTFQDWMNGKRSLPATWEWMMGFPIGWTDSADSATQLSLRSQK